MSEASSSVVTKLVDRVFPRMPDFYGLLNEQCDLVFQGMEVFERFMESGDKVLGAHVREIEKQGDVLKARNTDILNKAFSTPMDREDIYRAIDSIDQALNYAKTTVREMEVLELTTDDYLGEMASLMKEGVAAIRDGYGCLSRTPADAEAFAQAARKAERRTEKVYRRAIAELFSAEGYVVKLEHKEQHAEAEAMKHVIDMFKRREIYRHLSNAADQIALAANVLHDIVVKIS